MTTASLVNRTLPHDRLELLAAAGMFAVVAALQLSIAAAAVLMSATFVLWVGLLVHRREWPAAPPIFAPLVAYAAWTLVSCVFSTDPLEGIIDSKQLLLFLLVPAVYRLAQGDRANTVLTVIISVGAVSAIYGIAQYGIFHFDSLQQRPRGTMSHYMTYSGLITLAACAAIARLLFQRRERIWSALVLPALLVALAVTFTRGAWVGACAAMAVLLVLKDFRLLVALPLLTATFLALAPQRVCDRVFSMFDLNDPTSRDRIAMAEVGLRMIQDDPFTGTGPNLVEDSYPKYRPSSAVQPVNPHLHNVPLQIAAERGLPALLIWGWFLWAATRGAWEEFRRGRHRPLAAAALASLAAMLASGLFEYNFGDSEYLMLLLVLITLPYAAARELPA